MDLKVYLNEEKNTLLLRRQSEGRIVSYRTPLIIYITVCPGIGDPPKKINIFASENEVYTIYQLLRYFRLNIIRLQSKIVLGHMNSIG